MNFTLIAFVALTVGGPLGSQVHVVQTEHTTEATCIAAGEALAKNLAAIDPKTGKGWVVAMQCLSKR